MGEGERTEAPARAVGRLKEMRCEKRNPEREREGGEGKGQDSHTDTHTHTHT